MAKIKKGGAQNAWKIPEFDFSNMFTILLLLIVVCLIISMFLEEPFEYNYEEAAKKGLVRPDWATLQSTYARSESRLPV